MEHRDHGKLFQAGIDAFNSRHFYEAHEHWEEVWLGTALPEKLYLQGMIQIAAAFHHYSKANPTGTKNLLRAGLAKLEPCPPANFGVDIDSLREAARGWLAALEAGHVAADRALPRVVTCA